MCNVHILRIKLQFNFKENDSTFDIKTPTTEGHLKQ